MTKSQHTKGTWEVSSNLLTVVSLGHPELGKPFIAKMCSGLFPSEECEANARLIAASPELLAALKMLTDAANSHIELCDEVEAARAAIAKATNTEAN